MAWDASVLGWRQNRFFQDLADIYSVAHQVNSSTGLPGDEQVASAYTGVRCAFTPTSNIDDPGRIGRALRPSLETEDQLHVHSSVMIRDGYYVMCLTPGAINYGSVFRVQGAAQNLPALGVRNVNESHFLIIAVDKTPAGIPDPPPDPA